MRIVLLRLMLIGVLGWGTAHAQPAPAPPQHRAETKGADPKPARKPAHRPARHPEARPPSPVVHARPVPARHPVRPPPTPPLVAAPPPAPAPGPDPAKDTEPSKGSNTGNPLPRFATLRSDDVNLRTGPGTRYPIDWIYKRRDLPVMIEREFDAWRLVEDSDGVKGWVHQATLTGRRTGVVTGGERVLRSDPRDESDAVARLKPGVIVRLRSCGQGSDWCQATIQDYRGWIRRSDVWGLLPNEVVQ